MSARPPRRRGERGSTTTEAVLVTPALIFLVMLVVQFGLWFHAQHVAQAAAEEGARAGRAERGSSAAGRDRTNAFLDQAGPTILTGRQVTVGRTPEAVTITVGGRSRQVVPGYSLPIRAVASSPLERFRSEDG